jgi:hypothetical protein
MTDRYLRLILTVIAIELAWIGFKDVIPVPVSAQRAVNPTPVVITGINLTGRPQLLPVGIVGGVTGVDAPRGVSVVPMSTRIEPGARAVRADITGAVDARVAEPIRILTSPAEPLDVKSVTAQGGPRPGI